MSRKSGGLLPNYGDDGDAQDEEKKEKKKRLAAIKTDDQKAKQVKNATNLLSGESLKEFDFIDLMTPAKTSAGKKELDRLLTIFEARRSEIQSRVSRPGVSQTRLV